MLKSFVFVYKSRMSSVSRYADEHTLYIISGAARNEDLKSAVFRAIKKYEKEHKQKLPCEIIANLIYDREGLPYGFGYLYLSNPQVYHMLLGKNPDGSERTEIVEKDVDYLAFSEDLDLKEIPWFDWADAAEEIEIRSLPPLMTLPSFYYRKEQIEQLKKLVEKLKLSERKQLDPDQFNATICNFKLDAGLVKPVDEKYSAHILCAQGVPDWLTRKDIYNRFCKFVSNKNNCGKTYPLISINKKNKMVFVEFDSNTRDAQFALLMTTKLNFEFTANFRSGKPRLNKTLIFTHAFRSNRN